MEYFGLSVFDLAVIGVAVLAALIGLMTGIIRGGLFLGSWILAILIAMFAYPSVLPFVGDLIEAEWMAMLAAAGGTFLVSLVVLLLISQLIVKLVRTSQLNMLDRSLGMVAGIVIAIGVLAVIYLPISANFPDGDYPDWIRDAKTRPVIESASTIVITLIPETLRARLKVGTENTLDDAGSAVLERLNAAPPITLDEMGGEPGGGEDSGSIETILDTLNETIENER